MPIAELGYFSAALGMQNSCSVRIPDVPGPWHVMFLLHGLSDDHTIWLRRTRLDSYLEGIPLLVVMPHGGRGFYVDAEQGFAYGTAIGVELPALIESWFRTRSPWCISGLSMGGYGAVKLALTHPERFVSAVSLSGAMDFGHTSPNYRPDPEWTRILGDSPAGGPCDLYALAELPGRPAIRLDCGTEDFLIAHNRGFHAHLEAIGYPHEYEERPGDHNWEYWDLTIRPAIDFHRKNLGF